MKEFNHPYGFVICKASGYVTLLAWKVVICIIFNSSCGSLSAAGPSVYVFNFIKNSYAPVLLFFFCFISKQEGFFIVSEKSGFTVFLPLFTVFGFTCYFLVL